MVKKEDKIKVERYIAELSSDLEKGDVESLLANGEKNSDLKNALESDWENLGWNTSSSEPDLNLLLDRIHGIILKDSSRKHKKLSLKILNIYMKAAAILLFPLLIAGGLKYYFTTNKSTSKEEQQVSSSIYAPMGSRVSFNLPDGTNGILNSGSTLSYSIPFTNNRKVKLEGEVWFDVKQDSDHPFEIFTGSSIIKVLGTSFNLSAYPEENYVEVVLSHGKVMFLDSANNEMETLLPSERLVFQSGILNKSVTDPSKYTSWTEGKLVFRGDPMTEVARRIERWYNVKVVVVDKEIENYSFRATFEDDDIEEVLRFLSMTSPITYKIKPRTLLEDGTYKKEEVSIYLRK